MFLTQLLHRDPDATVSEMRWTPFSVRFRATMATTTLTISDATGTPFPGGLVLDGLAVSPAAAAAANTTYTYRVRANNNTGASAWSNEASALVGASP
jgi:hypothetical protein